MFCYHPLPTSGDATNPQDEGPFAGYDPQDNGPPAGDNDEGEDEGTEEEGASPEEGYTCHPTTWDEAKRIVVEGTAEERYGLVRDILLAALEGFGDQVGDLADLASDLASKAFEEVTEYIQDPLGYLQDTLDSALQMASDAMDYMGDVDRIIDQLKELFNNKDALIDELKNGVGQELYNDYVAPVLCGPVDMMKLITQNVGLGVPTKAVKVFNKLRKAMGLPEFPDTPDRPDRPEGPDGPDRPDNPNNPDRPNNRDDPDNPDRPNNPDGGNANNPDNQNNNSNHYCASFPASTPILTEQGPRPIESLQIGDRVWSRSEVTFEDSLKPITELFSRQSEGYWILETETGQQFRATSEHPIWQQGQGWVAAKDLDEYSPVASRDGDLLITVKYFVPYGTRVYNFSVADDRSYFAGVDEIWVHNAPACVLLTDQERNKVRLLEQELKTARLALLRYQNGNDMTEAGIRLRRQRIADLEEMLFKITHLPNNRPSATGTGILAQKTIPAFDPTNGNAYKKLTNDEDRRKYLEEYARRVGRQEDALNKMTANDLKAAFDAWDTQGGRNPLAADLQQNARSRATAAIAESIEKSIIRDNQKLPDRQQLSRSEIKQKSQERVSRIMRQLAALHEPDQVAGGWLSPDPEGFGNRRVNSSIGGSWNQEGRVSSIRAAVDAAITSGRGDDLMNIQLPVLGTTNRQ